MKKTIREDIEEKYLRTVLINDNALLIYTEDENNPDRINVRVRYVDSSVIKDGRVTNLTREQFETRRNIFLKLNSDRTALAVYREQDEGMELDFVYDLIDHTHYTTHDAEPAYNVMFRKDDQSQYVRK